MGAVRGGSLSSLPLAGGWTKHRELPAPQGKTFQQMWAERNRR
jgi:L-lactate dehydrogenase complex protein LldF